MADADDVRRLALALPHVVEIDSDGFDFRVGGKGFVWSYPDRVPGRRRVIRTDIAVLYVGDEAEKQALLLGEPELFFSTAAYDHFPLVMVRLDRVDAITLLELPAEVPTAATERDLAEGLFVASPDDIPVVLELAPPAHWVADYYAVDQVDQLGGDLLLVRLRVADHAWLRQLALRLGGALRVLDPPELADDVAAAARSALAAYSAV